MGKDKVEYFIHLDVPKNIIQVKSDNFLTFPLNNTETQIKFFEWITKYEFKRIGYRKSTRQHKTIIELNHASKKFANLIFF